MRATVRLALSVILAITIVGCARVDRPLVAPHPGDRPATIPLSIYAGLLRSMTVTVGDAAHPFIFDTGGGETMITPEVASAIGCTPYGRAIGFRSGSADWIFTLGLASSRAWAAPAMRTHP